MARHALTAFLNIFLTLKHSLSFEPMFCLQKHWVKLMVLKQLYTK